jgi:hypothetical protein
MSALACLQQLVVVEGAGPCLESAVEVEVQMMHLHPAWGEVAGELMSLIRVEGGPEERPMALQSLCFPGAW